MMIAIFDGYLNVHGHQLIKAGYQPPVGYDLDLPIKMWQLK